MAKNVIFRIQRASKRVNPSKSPFRKFDPKIIFFLIIDGYEKEKKVKIIKIEL